ncbi:NADH:ubiquinone reductase (Na(+)-transporting) subunit C, partial [Gammaproteobacteria bacterium]|nr:NADH:ubiquinone reductase (Na(+)-transporting) subunit C [Gammaproteobacteria bacterium]
KIYDESIDVKTQFSKLEMKYVDFNTGKILDSYEGFVIEEYDQLKSTRDPNLSTSISASDDIAIIKNRENVGKFFIVRNDDLTIDKLILPIRGYGLWGTLYGYMAIEEDFNTVAGLEFYDHKETPGLGAEVDNPRWKAMWPGKKIYKNDEVKLTVIKGKVQSDDANNDYKVDGLSGATLTSRGVTNMITYWFGDSGYSKLFKELNYES